MNKFDTARDFYLTVRAYFRFIDTNCISQAEELRTKIQKELQEFTKHDVETLPFKVAMIGNHPAAMHAIHGFRKSNVILITDKESEELRAKTEPLIKKITAEIHTIEEIIGSNRRARRKQKKLKK